MKNEYSTGTVERIKMSTQLRKELANYSHEAWAGWMKYMFQFGTFNEDGSWTMQSDKVNRWARQANTPMSLLPDGEATSDYKEADKIINIINNYRKE